MTTLEFLLQQYVAASLTLCSTEFSLFPYVYLLMSLVGPHKCLFFNNNSRLVVGISVFMAFLCTAYFPLASSASVASS